MKVTISVALASVALAGLATKASDGTTGTATGTEVEGKLRIAVLNGDGSVNASQDIDDTGAASEAVFAGIAAGSYTASAQRLTSDGLELGTAFTQPFSVTDQSTQPTGTTVRQAAGITVNVTADDAADTGTTGQSTTTPTGTTDTGSTDQSTPAADTGSTS